MNLDLNLPEDRASPRPRRKSKRVWVGGTAIGDGAPVAVQSMCTTLTHDVDATILEARPPLVEGLAADDAYVMSPLGKARRPLIGEALRAAHRRIRAFREEDLHSESLPCKVAAVSRVRMRPRTRPYR